MYCGLCIPAPTHEAKFYSLSLYLVFNYNPAANACQDYSREIGTNWLTTFRLIDTVNQGNWCLSIKLRLECFVIIAKCKQYAKALTYSKNNTKIQGC